MSNHPLSETVHEAEALQNRWRWQKWFQLLSGAAFIIIGFYTIVATKNFHYSILHLPTFFLMAVGGSMLGSVLKKWKGSNELKLLGKFTSHYKDDANNT